MVSVAVPHQVECFEWTDLREEQLRSVRPTGLDGSLTDKEVTLKIIGSLQGVDQAIVYSPDFAVELYLPSERERIAPKTFFRGIVLGREVTSFEDAKSRLVEFFEVGVDQVCLFDTQGILAIWKREAGYGNYRFVFSREQENIPEAEQISEQVITLILSVADRGEIIVQVGGLQSGFPRNSLQFHRVMYDYCCLRADQDRQNTAKCTLEPVSMEQASRLSETAKEMIIPKRTFGMQTLGDGEVFFHFPISRPDRAGLDEVDHKRTDKTVRIVVVLRGDKEIVDWYEKV